MQVTVEFTGPSGEFHVDAFWDGGACWRVRFSPEQTGRWQWRTRCSRPDDSGLHGIEVSSIATKRRRGMSGSQTARSEFPRTGATLSMQMALPSSGSPTLHGTALSNPVRPTGIFISRTAAGRDSA